ncbi:MAG: response regulator transcription factor [Flavobacteriales bacterium]|nr:Transcriptional regulatory protein BtsR [Flavobacteriales bacterium]MCC6576578.1 response regulator transcription factor [Flavobacteriales bacterium]NUQ15698.1 response regulator transcription factor [Flavobacteriales bacterium]
MTPTAYIVEDEPQARELIRVLLAKRHPRVRLLGEADDVHTAADEIRVMAPQMLFLDVDLGGLDGFDLLRRIAPVEPLVIFTTGQAGHAVQAFDVRAVDFLVKPISGPRFDEAVLRALELLERRVPQVPPGMVVSDRRIALPDARGLTLLPLDELLYCTSDNNYTQVHRLGEARPLVVSRGIVDFDEALREQGFVRIHKRHLVNRKHIRRYIKGEGGEVIMIDGANLPVSRRQKADLMEALERL